MIIHIATVQKFRDVTITDEGQTSWDTVGTGKD